MVEDTLVAYTLSPFKSNKGRKTVATEKFYFFDTGVAHVLLGRKSIVAGTPDFGKALEHFVFLELKAYLSYQRLDNKLTYWRTKSQLEVDFVIDDKIAIEVKGSGRVVGSDLKALRAIKEDLEIARSIIVCNEAKPRISPEGIEIMPIEVFCQKLWDQEIFS